MKFFKDVPQLFLRVFDAWRDESTVKGTFELSLRNLQNQIVNMWEALMTMTVSRTAQTGIIKISRFIVQLQLLLLRPWATVASFDVDFC